MLYLQRFILAFSFLVGSSQAFCETFEQAIQKDSFKIEPSKIDLEKMNNASTLVIGCVDFRLRDEMEKLLREHLHLLDSYNELNLPGASLAFVESTKPHWGQTIEEIIGLVRDLHQVKQVIFIDHMGCGAYRILKGDEVMKTKETERAAHLEEFKKARAKMKEKFPELKVHTLLMHLDGKVENIKE